MTFNNNQDTKYELKNDHGNLFRNKKKKTPEEAAILSPEDRSKNERMPHWSGKLKLNDQEFFFSAWEKTTKKGDLFFNLKLGGMVPAEPTNVPFNQHAIDKGNAFAPSDSKDLMDDEIPF